MVAGGRRKLFWIAGTSVFAILLFILLTPLPSPLFNNPYSTIIRSHDGILLSAAIAPDHQWRFPQSDSIPKKFDVAIRLFEDEYFYYHAGINPVSLLRALRQNFNAGKVISGGSTISMQTVRMAFGNKPRTYIQKLIEIAATIKLELLYSKKSIIKTYADHAPYGGNLVGISAASWRYFGRPPYQLSWAETATLAILPNDPASIFPGKNTAQLLQKRNRLLEKIHARGYLDSDAYYLASQEPLPSQMKSLPNYAYHLLHRSIQEGQQGKNVISTIDIDLQLRVNKIVNRYSYEMAKNEIHNAAAIVIDIATGDALSYVGNSNNTGEHGQHVDIITARRSPGSLLKPILYAAALDDGIITPKKLLPDVPLFYRGFMPKNFDKKYRGAVHADDALVSSLNVPFVHLLTDYGYEKFHHKLQQIGFKSIDQPPGHYGLSLILGSAESTLWELTGAYAGMARALANHSTRPYRSGYSANDYRGTTYIKNDEAIAVTDFEQDGFLRVQSIRYALAAMQKLRRPDSEKGWENFTSARPISWKTGTSFGFRDGWAIGLNGKYVVGVWLGNADGEGRPGLTGIGAAAPLLFKIFTLLDGDGKLEEAFGDSYKICSLSGMLAGKGCDKTIDSLLPEYMIGNTCTYHKTIHLNADKTKRVNSSCYDVSDMHTASWFVLPPVQSWYYGKYHQSYKKLPGYAPSCSETESKSLFDLIYPAQYTKVHIPLEQDGARGQVIFEATHENKHALIYWHIDSEYLGMSRGSHKIGVQADKGVHTLTLVDDTGAEISQRFEVVN